MRYDTPHLGFARRPSTQSPEQQTHDTTQSPCTTQSPGTAQSPDTTQSLDTATATPDTTTSSTTTSSTTTSSTTTPGTTTPDTATPDTATPQVPLFNNPLFNDLAKELTDTFNFDELEKDGKPQNIGDALSKFMTGNNPAKLMGLVGKFGNKLQQEVKNGSINPAELLKQTMGAMGNSTDSNNMQQTMANMMRQMAGAGASAGAGSTQQPPNIPQLQQSTKSQTTRDRLRAKLDKRT